MNTSKDTSVCVSINPAELIAVCFEQSDCNEEGITDFEDAFRILFEREGYGYNTVVANYFECLSAYYRQFGRIH